MITEDEWKEMYWMDQHNLLQFAIFLYDFAEELYETVQCFKLKEPEFEIFPTPFK